MKGLPLLLLVALFICFSAAQGRDGEDSTTRYTSSELVMYALCLSVTGFLSFKTVMLQNVDKERAEALVRGISARCHLRELEIQDTSLQHLGQQWSSERDSIEDDELSGIANDYSQNELERSNRAALALTIVLPNTTSWTNASFAAICAITTESTSLSVQSSTGLWLMPPCFSEKTWLTTLSLNSVVLQNWAHFPTAPGLTSITIYGSQLPNLGTNDAWKNSLFDRLPSLTNLVMNRCGLAGTLMTTMPYVLRMVDLSYNAISGTIPPTLFSNWTASSLTSININFNEIQGTLPPQLFSTISGFFTFSALNNSLTGSLPMDLGNATSSAFLSLDLSRNRLSGSIPDGFFSSASRFRSLTISQNLLSGSFPGNDWLSTPVLNLLDLQDNRLNGSMLSSVCSSSKSQATLNLANNQITGMVPATLISQCMLGSVADFSGNKGISGPLPPALLQDTQAELRLSNTSISGMFTSFALQGAVGTRLTASNTLLTGSIPSSLFYGSSFCEIDLSNNNIDGPISPSIFTGSNRAILNLDSAGITGSLKSNIFFNSTGATLNLNNNKLTGTIPNNLFDGALLTSPTPLSSDGFSFFASNNQLEGTLPLVGWQFAGTVSMAGNELTNWTLTSSALPSSASDLPHLLTSLDLSRNLLTEIPNDQVLEMLLSDSCRTLNVSRNPSLGGTIPLLNAPSKTLQLLNYDISSCNFTGPLLELINGTSLTRKFNLSNNALEGTFPTSWATAVFSDLDISNNIGINGTISTKPFANSIFQAINNLIISGTHLSGPMFDTSGLTFVYGARVDAQRSQYLNFCARLLNGTARAAWRPIEWVNCNLDGTPACECPELYPLCTSYSCPPNACTGTRPSLEFVCMDGKWTSATNVLDSRLIIYGTGKTIISGNLTSLDLVLSSLNASVVVQGCANNLSSVTVELTPEQLKTLQPTQLQSLITLEGASGDCADFSLSSLRVNITGSTCRRVSASKSSTVGTTLSGVFTLDNSKCKRWWIILVAVICGAIVVGIVIFILLVTFVPSIRRKVRPYTRALDSRKTQAKRDTSAFQPSAHGNESEE